MKEDEFYLQVAQALSGCQLVEQELKLYITEAFQLVLKCINGKMPFKMKGEDYADSSLQRLIDTFKKLTDNEQLVKDLNKFKKDRNFLSHRAIIYCLDYEGQHSDLGAADLQDKLDNIQFESERLRIEIHNEAGKFRAHIWFDPI